MRDPRDCRQVLGSSAHPDMSLQLKINGGFEWYSECPAFNQSHCLTTLDQGEDSVFEAGHIRRSSLYLVSGGLSPESEKQKTEIQGLEKRPEAEDLLRGLSGVGRQLPTALGRSQHRQRAIRPPDIW